MDMKTLDETINDLFSGKQEDLSTLSQSEQIHYKQCLEVKELLDPEDKHKIRDVRSLNKFLNNLTPEQYQEFGALLTKQDRELGIMDTLYTIDENGKPCCKRVEPDFWVH